jgi:hypothetical protein
VVEDLSVVGERPIAVWMLHRLMTSRTGVDYCETGVHETDGAVNEDSRVVRPTMFKRFGHGLERTPIRRRPRRHAPRDPAHEGDSK